MPRLFFAFGLDIWYNSGNTIRCSLGGYDMAHVIRWAKETEIKTVDWLWKPFIPYGKVTIIEGDGGEGKTTAILAVAAMLSQGIQPPALVNGHLQEEQRVDPITIFYASNEDEIADSTIPRFLRNGGDINRFAYSGELEHHITLNEEEVAAIIAETKARLFIIDPIQSFLPSGTHMGNVTQMRAIFTMLSNVAKNTGCAIVLVGHLNKNEASKDIHRGLGSADIAASVRSILLVGMDKTDRTRRYIRAIKSNFDEADYTPLSLVLDENRVLSLEECDELETEERPFQTKLERASSILRDMLENGPMPIEDIFEECEAEGIGDRTVRRAMKRIGAVSYSKGGITYWRLTN